jgi:hypothetical protein
MNTLYRSPQVAVVVSLTPWKSPAASHPGGRSTLAEVN